MLLVQWLKELHSDVEAFAEAQQHAVLYTTVAEQYFPEVAECPVHSDITYLAYLDIAAMLHTGLHGTSSMLAPGHLNLPHPLSQKAIWAP